MKQYKQQPIKSLVLIAQKGDNCALNEIVKRYKSRIYNEFLSLNIKNDLPDLTQDALTKIAKHIKKLSNPEKFDAWLHTMIKNIIRDSYRNTKKKANCVTNPIVIDNIDLGECIIDERKTPDENILACELKTRINTAIKNLSPLLKTIILLRDIEGLSYEEIAALLNINLGTVKSRLARARVKLRQELSPYIKNGD